MEMSLPGPEGSEQNNPSTRVMLLGMFGVLLCVSILFSGIIKFGTVHVGYQCIVTLSLHIQDGGGGMLTCQRKEASPEFCEPPSSHCHSHSCTRPYV